ncbi:zinc finger protein 600-like [Contarinia nasturtii]|uniref:zinc finger protein 600-like n=1 Tax=Contarinia nasturtii TaxID=265458 RepID=UPI0012D3C4BF|nr:zinc finger protein 600-like [Contarinia nasturtii]
MAIINTVHQCLFCAKTFGTATEKDDHTLEHFAQETCRDCDQKLLRIGGSLYTLHNSITCIRGQDVKVEKDIAMSRCGNEFMQSTENQSDKFSATNDIDYLSNSPIVEMRKLPIKPEPILKPSEPENVLHQLEHGLNNHPERIENEIDSDGILEHDNYSENIETVTSNTQNDVKGNQNKKERVQCDLCGKLIAKSYLLQHKKMLHRAPELSGCTYCCKIFTKDGLISHNTVCSSRRKNPVEYNCDNCNKIFHSPQRLNTHSYFKHKVVRPGCLLCKICNRIFSNKMELSKHKPECELKKHNRKLRQLGKFSCPLCNKTFGSRPSIRQHINWIHNENRKIACEICHELQTKATIEEHKRLHKVSKTYACHICSKIVANEKELMCHKQNCVLEFKCDICKKVFNTKVSIRQHINWIHNPEYKKNNQVACDICNKLMNKPALEGHKIRKHSKKGTIFCRLCTKIFSNEIELAIHKQECLVKFNQQDNNKIGKYKCDLCHKIFNAKRSLGQHKRISHKLKGRQKWKTIV